MKMKKTLVMFAMASLILASCETNPEGPGQESATIVSATMKVEKNSYLEVDLEVKNPDNTIDFVAPATVPDSLFKMAAVDFVLSDTAAVVHTADGTKIESGDTINLYKSIDIIVECKGRYTPYVISLRNAEISAALTWNYAGYSKTAAGDSLKMGSEMIMKVCPKTGKPYMLGYVTGASTANYYPMLLTFDGSNLKAAADTLAKVRSNIFGLDIAPDGTAFVSFYDQTKTLQTNGKVEGGKFVSLGTTIRSTCNVVTSTPVSAISSSNVFFGCMANAATDGVAKRGLYLTNYANGAATKPVQLPDWALTTVTYNAISRKVNGVDYLMVLDFSNIQMSVYKYDEGWKLYAGPIKPLKVDGVTPITTAEYTYQSIDFDIDSKGNVYVFAYADFGATADKVPAVVKYNVATKAQTVVGGVISTNAEEGHGNGVRWAAMALDANDNPYVAQANCFVSDKYGAKVWNIDPKTRSWAAPTQITKIGEKICGIDVEFAEDGTGYLCLFNDKTKLYEMYVASK